MSQPKFNDTMHLLREAVAGDRPSADRLMALLYDDFRALAGRFLAGETPAHVLQPTALVHEVYLKLIDQQQVDWRGRSHFFAVGAQAMRRLLVDHARHQKRVKRGGGLNRIPLDEQWAMAASQDVDVLAINEAIEQLAARDERQAKIVEMRFFGGLTIDEVAEVLGVSRRTVEAEWTMIRAWMKRFLSEQNEP